MNRTFAIALAATLLAAGCATDPSDREDRRLTATTLEVDGGSVGRDVLVAVPAESAMERFEIQDRNGHRVSYVAFTDTDVGGLLFIDNKLLGTVSKRDARAFYSCRGYVSATREHWAQDAGEWVDSLIASVAPASRATLNFSGKTTMRSIKEVVANPVLSDVKSLVGMGTNPLSIFRTLSNARSNMVEREKFDKIRQALRTLAPGDSEDKLASIVRPEDMSFTRDGLVMAYPRFLLDFYVRGGIVTVLQQPSFQRLARLHAAVFYVPGLRWGMCTPADWRHALPESWAPQESAEDEDADRLFSTAPAKNP